MLRKQKDDLTNRDLDIMNILWENENPMTASQIAQANPDLTINTVQAVIRKLLKKNLIKIDDIVYSGTVLCRSYCPTISANDFTLLQFSNEYQKVKKIISKSALISSLLGNETNTKIIKKDIEELQSVIDEYKKKL